LDTALDQNVCNRNRFASVPANAFSLVPPSVGSVAFMAGRDRSKAGIAAETLVAFRG
jgi:hypothetical protein